MERVPRHASIHAVTVLDWAILAFTIALGLWGYRQGLIVGALTLVGFGAGRLRRQPARRRWC